MEPKESPTDKLLSETLSMMADIKKQESEMNKVLDLIEERRNISSLDSVNDSCTVEPVDNESTGRNAAMPSCHSSHSEGMSENKPRGILKSPNKGSKETFGFIEQFDLNESSVMYGSVLRRKCVSMNQDNRLCLRFGFQPNLGCVYESLVSTDSEVVRGKRNSCSRSNRPMFSGCEDKLSGTAIRGEGPNHSQGAIPKSTNSTHDTPIPQPSQAPVSKPSRNVEVNQSAMAYAKLDNEHKRPTEERDKNQLEAGEGTLTLTEVLETVKTYWKEREGQFKSVGVDVPEMIGKLSDKLNSGEMTMEDVMSIQKEMTDVMNDMLEDSGVDVGEEQMEQLQKAAKLFENNENASIEISSTTVNPPSSVESQQTDSECEEEPMFIDHAAWAHYAEKEVKNGKYARDIREKGLDTIFCLDMSSSMKGLGWEQAKEFIKNFIEGIQTFNLIDDVFEHVALVTFGDQTRVQQHLTCDYLEVTRKLDGLKPGRQSPLYAGLKMVHAAVLGAGQVFVSNGYHMHPRVFLLTDGKPTDSGQVNGPDKYSSLKPVEELNILAEVKLLCDKYHIKVNPIPVGNFELPLLEKIAKVSKGKIVSPDDWRVQTRAFRNYLAAARIDQSTLKNSPELISILLNAVLSDASPEDRNQVEEFLIDAKKESSAEGLSDDEQIPGLPPLGSRVRRLVPGQSIQKLSVGQLGTVTKHISRESVGITWDVSLPTVGLRQQVQYSDTERGVFVVDEPRILKDELIAVGCRVERGKDWKYGMQDGGPGHYGNVFDVGQNGVVKVRWDCGGVFTYRFGEEGKFDIEIVGRKKLVKKTTKEDGNETRDEEDTEKKRIQEMNERNKPLARITNDMGGAGACGVSTSSSSEMSNNVKIDANEKKQKSEEIGFGNSRTVNRQPKSEGVSVTSSGDVSSASSTTAVSVQWMWQDGEQWHPYPADVNKKIESGYTKHPSGTCVIEMKNEQFRIVFSQLKQIHIVTRDKVTIKRSTKS